MSTPFQIVDATISSIHDAFLSGRLTARQLVEGYLLRIAAYDQQGPALNAIISLNPDACADADKLDAEFARTGISGRPLHGIPVILKDQIDVVGLPTTLGSTLFKGFLSGRDATLVTRLRHAGAIILGKATLGELGGGDTHGSLFGSTRNVFDLERTAGGSSGGPAVCVSANFCTVAVAQEGFSSIRRPAIWNGIVGMRPTAGLVGRGGVYNGWPSKNGAVGPMARTCSDLAKLLDVMVGYDSLDPLSAYGVGHAPPSYADALDGTALQGARVGVLRDCMGYQSGPETDDFRQVTEVFDRALLDLRTAGATVIDNLAIPELAELMATRTEKPGEDEDSFQAYFGPCPKAPFSTRQMVTEAPGFKQVMVGSQARFTRTTDAERYARCVAARESLMTNMLKLMADHRLDVLVHKAVEHQPTLIADGVQPPYTDQKGAISINTFLVFVPSIVVPSGFTRDRLPAGITFLGRPYDDARMIRLAHAYEAVSRHRRVPDAVPAL